MGVDFVLSLGVFSSDEKQCGPTLGSLSFQPPRSVVQSKVAGSVSGRSHGNLMWTYFRRSIHFQMLVHRWVEINLKSCITRSHIIERCYTMLNQTMTELLSISFLFLICVQFGIDQWTSLHDVRNVLRLYHTRVLEVLTD